jgi:hypothetical protein
VALAVSVATEFQTEIYVERLRHPQDSVKARIDEGWHFTFLGANQDAIEEGRSMGVAAASSLNYAADPGRDPGGDELNLGIDATDASGRVKVARVHRG